MRTNRFPFARSIQLGVTLLALAAPPSRAAAPALRTFSLVLDGVMVERQPDGFYRQLELYYQHQVTLHEDGTYVLGGGDPVVSAWTGFRCPTTPVVDEVGTWRRKGTRLQLTPANTDAQLAILTQCTGDEHSMLSRKQPIFVLRSRRHLLRGRWRTRLLHQAQSGPSEVRLRGKITGWTTE